MGMNFIQSRTYLCMYFIYIKYPKQMVSEVLIPRPLGKVFYRKWIKGGRSNRSLSRNYLRPSVCLTIFRVSYNISIGYLFKFIYLPEKLL